MSLLSANDPRYWLAKIVAAPAKTTFSQKDFADILYLVGRANNISATALTEISNTQLFLVTPFPWDKGPYPDLVTSFVSRYDAFKRKYSSVQVSNGVVVAPDLKADAIEMLTWAVATTDKIRSIYGWTEGLGAAIGAVAEVGSRIYEALAGTVQKLVAGLAIGGSVLITAGLAAVGLWAYVSLKRPSYRRY